MMVTAAGELRFRFRLLGDFRLIDEADGRDHSPRSRKACALLAHLALEPDRRASRDRLVGLLWSDRGEVQARASLRQALTDLRAHPAAPLIQIERRDLYLAEGGFSSDLGEILACAAANDLAGLARVLDGAGSAILDGLEGLDRSFDDWLMIERQRWRERIVQDVLHAVERNGQDDLLDLRRAILTQLQRLDTGDERIARLGMALDQKAGDHVALHRRYRQLETGLQRDLDARVSPDTERLLRELTTVGSVIAPAPRAAAAPSVATIPQANVEPPILVIAPFSLIGDGGPDGALLTSICHDDLQTALGGMRDLRILSVDAPSAERMKAAAPASIASYALDGSVRADGDGWRINLRMTRIDSGFLVWTRQLTVRQGELLAAIDDLVARIAGAILPVVERDVGKLMEGRVPSGSDAYPLYFTARAKILAAASLAEVQEGADLLERAILLEPRLTNAYLQLARLYNTDFMQLMAGHDAAPLRARAFDLCTRAVALEPTHGGVQSRLAWCYLRRGDMKQAMQGFMTALDLTPFHADGINEIGFGLVHLGEMKKAQRLIARAFELNPFPSDEYFSDLAVLYALSGEHEAAETQFEIGRNRSIHYLAVRGANLGMLGGAKQAAPVIEELRQRFASLWQGDAPARDADLVDTMIQFLPLQGPAERSLFLTGLEQAGLRITPR
ncbi:trifolitoxin synthesis, TfuA [Sphingobium yanoikuyae]|uniref:Trifolitoxin synthesis, TfuA n=1 Tax=Sphingobium yanoikuyae TaxID=13690 RepID=A0A6P1GM34_SPHYA|nr:trifolitoxin synthesis, TfuA [Sphingobium yanoikuyae]QHD68551.1 trifolitoxin synthesis, TfuA [Sphingobium yanoikuyae]